MLKDWCDLPDNMKNESVRKYYDILHKKRGQLVLKKLFDIIVAFIMLVILLPLFLIIAIIIKADSKGPVFFRQTRVTRYGRTYKIFKFRTMIPDSENVGSQVTIKNDMRITRVGRFLRKYRLDEIPQLLNVLIHYNMSFVGTRPEVVKYVEGYTDEMMATLLLPAGITSEASIKYKDEEMLLSNVIEKNPKEEKVLSAVGTGKMANPPVNEKEGEEFVILNEDNADTTYMNQILPQKMKHNLESIKKFSFAGDIKTMIRTVVAVMKKGGSST